ncbi:MAG: hypothetical protein PHH16_00730 [Candidatus Gracilibacteria bacterium]|nr:hypothetical protein [Candidatus Gracilibacteria bacterium]
MSEIDYKKKIESMKKKCGEEFLSNFFELELGFGKIEDVLPALNLSTNKVVWDRLLKIINVGETYSRIISIEGFQKFIKNSYKLDIINSTSIFSLIYEISNKDNKIFEKLEKNYEISFGGAFHFYEINIDKYSNNIINYLDAFKDALRHINDEFSILSQSATLILPYTPEGEYNDYYIVHHGSKRKNKEIRGYVTELTTIESTNSFYFFFQEVSGKHFLVLKRPFHEGKVTYLFQAIDKVLGATCTYAPLPIISFKEIQNGKRFNKNVLELLGIKLSHTDHTGVVMTIDGKSWSTALSDLLPNSEEKIKIHEIDFKHEHYNGKKLEISISGSSKPDEIKTIGEKLEIGRMINIFSNEDVRLIGSNLEDIFSWEKFIQSSLFSESIIFEKKYIDYFETISSYVKEYVYIGAKIEGANGSKISKSDIRIDKNLVFALGDSDTLEGNVKLVLDHEALLVERLTKNAKFKFTNCVGAISFKGRNKGVEVLCSDSIKNISAYLNENFDVKKKYLFFTGDDPAINTKFNLAEKYHAGSYSKSTLSRLVLDAEDFISIEGDKIILNGHIGKSLPGEESSSIDFLKLANAGDGSAFENAICKILPIFFPFFMQFGNQYIGKAIPDGIIKAKGENDNVLISLYDAKSSGKIIEYINKESRKVDDYIGLFPKSNDNCVFIIFGPEVTTSEIEDLKNRVIWKKAIEDDKGKILYIGSKVLDFFAHIARFENFDAVRGYLNMEKITQHILDEVKIPSIKCLELKKLQKEIIDTYLGDPTEVDKDIGKKLKERTDGKLNLSEKHAQFKEYIKNYN